MQVKSKHASCRLHYQEERLPMWEQDLTVTGEKRHRYPILDTDAGCLGYSSIVMSVWAARHPLKYSSTT